MENNSLYLIKNGHVLDPASGKDGIYNIVVKDGIIAAVDNDSHDEIDNVIDAAGCYVMPGLLTFMFISGNRVLNTKRQ